LFRSAVVGAPAAATATADAIEAVPAVDGAVAARLEGHAGDVTAAAAGDFEHFALDAGRPVEPTGAAIAAFAFAAALSAAGAAALGLAKAAGLVELLVITAE